MNIFRLAGDLSHLLAIIILLLKIWSSRSCAGISGKSQMMFALTYTTRYLDLFTNYISLYNSSMKVIFLAASYATLYLIYIRFKATYDHNHDTFRVEFLLIPTVILSLLINHDYSPLEVYRFYAEGFYDLIAIVAGVVQTVLYCDFFYLYITKVLQGKKLQLPA
ncbi:hypothetical protein OTU49_001073 [Cherax quadricarinatus]|uniref:ER lumen protein-retaining receptor n=1 Tax=Cherax quadricarinatus TaxID=27406 RepID=A0AAW0YCK9_CHEQU